MWGFSCKGWLQKLFVFPILRSLAQGVLFGSFVLFRSHCSPVTFRRRDSPIMHSSVPDEFKPVIFEAGRTIDHLGLCTHFFWCCKMLPVCPVCKDTCDIYHTMWCCYRFSWKNRIKVNQLFWDTQGVIDPGPECSAESFWLLRQTFCHA